ncbi:MAG: tetratricopeptide repeat protein [Verrucomicrobiota bacterium]
MQSETTASNSMDFDSFMAWLHFNRKRVAIGAAIVAVMLIGVAIFIWKKNQNELDANDALFALPSLVGASGRTNEVRSEDFAKVAHEYPKTRAAERAELLAAGILFTDGKYVEAQREFSKFMDERESSPLRAQAAIGVAASLEAQGKINEAVPKYQELIAKYSGENIISPAKLTLARLLETQNKSEDALKLYDDLARSQNPYDPWAAEAKERREQLFQKLPNLKNKPAIPASAPAKVPILMTNAPAAITNKTPAK